MNFQRGDFMLGLSGFALLFGIWELCGRAFTGLALFLPPVSEVLAFSAKNASLLAFHAVFTLGFALMGFAIAILGALVIVTIFRFSRAIAKIVGPLAASLQFFPKEALSPLFVVLLGLGFSAKLAFVTVICFVPLYIVGMRELIGTETEEERALCAFGKSDLYLFFAVRFPVSAIPLLSACRLAVGLSLVGAMVFELLYGSRGLGYLLKTSAMQINQHLLYASVLLAGVLGAICYSSILFFENLLSPRLRGLMDD